LKQGPTDRGVYVFVASRLTINKRLLKQKWPGRTIMQGQGQGLALGGWRATATSTRKDKQIKGPGINYLIKCF